MMQWLPVLSLCQTAEFLYYDQNGHMAHGERQIDGEWYHFNESMGAMSKGFTRLPDGRLVYYDKQGRMYHGIHRINDNIYKFHKNTGEMLTGWQFDSQSKKLQYYSNNGMALIGSATVGGQRLHFNNDGFLDNVPEGQIDVGNDTWAYVNSDGTVVTGFKQLPNKTVYYDPETALMRHGESQINGSWYFFDYNTGEEAKNAFIQLRDGRTTYYDGEGHMVHGERNINGHWYHFDENCGAMSRGFA